MAVQTVTPARRPSAMTDALAAYYAAREHLDCTPFSDDRDRIQAEGQYVDRLNDVSDIAPKNAAEFLRKFLVIFDGDGCFPSDDTIMRMIRDAQRLAAH